jgi:hypothetical protein
MILGLNTGLEGLIIMQTPWVDAHVIIITQNVLIVLELRNILRVVQNSSIFTMFESWFLTWTVILNIPARFSYSMFVIPVFNLWNRTVLNFCGIVVTILKMETDRNFSMSGIISGHHNLPTYEILLFFLFLQNGGPLKNYSFWEDVYSSLEYNYVPTAFAGTLKPVCIK